MKNKIVSIIVPCLNERNYIEKFLDDALNQKIGDWILEVIVADGGSNDGTREILDGMVCQFPQLQWIDNPLRIVSTGLNLAIAKASGSVIIRMDVHSHYKIDYVLKCIKTLEDTGATCVGGPWIAKGYTPTQRAIAAAFQSRIGSGGASSRITSYSGWVDTVYLGAWWRNDLLKLGGFDESLVRNQDDELALRINRQGGRIWQSSEISSNYVPRSSMTALFRQFSQYGYWKIPVILKHRLPASSRHLAPFAFFSVILFLAISSLFWGEARFALLGFIFIYLLALVFGTSAQRTKLNKGDPQWLTIVAVGVMHIGYAIGFGRAIFDLYLNNTNGRKSMSKTTR
jgi:glycosyltransferase involved in cell wall biosynthesis